MRITPPAAIASSIIAAVLIGILIGFQVPAAKSATTPQPPAPHATATTPQPPAPHATATTPQPPAPHATATTGHGAPSVKADPRVQRGQQVFTQYCATCHGPEGKGDGISAQNLPIKPQDLTVGRQLNPLPDHFLFNMI